MLARKARPLVDGLTDVGSIVEQNVEIASVDWAPALGPHALVGQFPCQNCCRSDLRKAVEDHPYRRGFIFIHNELAVFHLVAEGRVSAFDTRCQMRRIKVKRYVVTS